MKAYLETLSIRLGGAFIFPGPRTVTVSSPSRREIYVLSLQSVCSQYNWINALALWEVIRNEHFGCAEA